MNKHAGVVKELLTSWKPHLPRPFLVFRAYRDWLFTRRGFAEVPRGLGPIAEGWRQTLDSESFIIGDYGDHHHAQYECVVNIYDSDDKRQ